MNSSKSKLKKKMAMIAREREEYEIQKISMQKDIDYMVRKDTDKEKDKDKDKDDSTNGNDSENSSIRQTGLKGKRSEDGNTSISRKHATTDDGDTSAPSVSSSKRGGGKNIAGKYRRNSIHTSTGGGSGGHIHRQNSGGKNSAIGRCLSSSDLSGASEGSPRPLPIPSGKKISNWCYTAAPDSTPPILKGQQDLYIDIRFIGRGAFGTVDLFKNKEDNKLYAVKTMLVKNKEDQTNFLHEVKYLRNRHPFIIHLHDVFITTNPKKVYLVMHYCEGGDLGNAIALALKGQHPIQEGLIFKWFSQISLAVNFLHNLRIVHRDIKPQNILLSDNGEVAQLADFGLATQLLPTEDSFESCEVGTPYFTAPEMINAKPCSFPVDNWSLGVVLFELLALKLPFDGDDTVALVKCILTEQYRIELIPEGMYSPDLLGVVEGLLCKDPQTRMTSQQILTSPGIAAKAAYLPSSYRPKYLEERLKRAYVKQMLRQLEMLDIHCASSVTPSSTRNMSPANSFHTNHSTRDVQGAPKSTAASPIPSPREEYPVVQLDTAPLHRKTPVMRSLPSSPAGRPPLSTSISELTHDTTTSSAPPSPLLSPDKPPKGSDKIISKSHAESSGDGSKDDLVEILSPSMTTSNHVTSTPQGTSVTPFSSSASTTSAASSSSIAVASVSSLSSLSSASSAPAPLPLSNVVTSTPPPVITSVITTDREAVLEELEKDEEYEEGLKEENEEVKDGVKEATAPPNCPIPTSNLTPVSVLISDPNNNNDDSTTKNESNLIGGGVIDTVDNNSNNKNKKELKLEASVDDLLGVHILSEVQEEVQEEVQLQISGEADHIEDQTHGTNRDLIPISLANYSESTNNEDAKGTQIVDKKHTPKIENIRHDDMSPPLNEKKTHKGPDITTTDTVITISEKNTEADANRRNSNSDSVVSLPPINCPKEKEGIKEEAVMSTSSVVSLPDLTGIGGGCSSGDGNTTALTTTSVGSSESSSLHVSTSKPSRWRKHPHHAQGRRHSIHHCHPLEAARLLVSPKGSIEGEDQHTSKHIVNNQRRCKSGTTRVVDVVFLKEADMKGVLKKD